MRNLIFNLSGFKRDSVRDTAYRISQSSKSYSFFQDEYLSLPRFTDNSFIVLANETAQERRDKRRLKLERLKELLICSKSSLSIPISSSSSLFFLAEYRNNICEDLNHNIIVPTDVYSKHKTR